jgi:hypothetical protein
MATTVRNDKTADVFKKLKQLKTGYVTIGLHGDAGKYEDGTDVVTVGLWNEFGTESIPERSFFRTAIDGNQQKINAWREEMLKNIFENNWSVEKALKAIGLRIQILVQNKIKSNVPPPNAPSTDEAKTLAGVGHKTLINTGLMLRSVTFKVVT